MLVYGAGAGAAIFCLEPEPPKKVVAPQHCFISHILKVVDR